MNIEEIKKEIRNMELTKEEKSEMLKRIFNAPFPSPYSPIKTNWKFSRKTLVYIFACLLLMVISGGGISYAALGSVPGEPLYAVKVNITEPILDAFAFTPASRAERQAEKAIARLNEAEKLAEKDKLTPDKKTEIEKRFNQSAEKFNVEADSIDKISPSDAETLRASFDTSLEAHINQLDNVNNSHKSSNVDQQEEVNSLQNTVRERFWSKNHDKERNSDGGEEEKGKDYSRNRSIMDE